jgi:hypothetical protein
MIRKAPYLVLRGEVIRAKAVIDPYRNVNSIPIRVRLVPAQASTVFVHLSPPAYAVLHPPAGAEGAPIVAEAYRCRKGFSTIRGFHVTYTLYLVPRCAHVVEWHVIAGWLNEPVATIDDLPLP